MKDLFETVLGSIVAPKQLPHKRKSERNPSFCDLFSSLVPLFSLSFSVLLLLVQTDSKHVSKRLMSQVEIVCPFLFKTVLCLYVYIICLTAEEISIYQTSLDKIKGLCKQFCGDVKKSELFLTKNAKGLAGERLYLFRLDYVCKFRFRIPGNINGR